MGLVYNPLLGLGLDQTGASPAATPGGSNTQVQYNDAGALVGDANFTWNKTTRAITASGFKFPATQFSSADPNTLDDYEEGSWTPAVFDTTNANISSLFTTAGNYAQYTKIGRLVTITFAFYSGDAVVSQLIKRIEGLPFVMDNFNYGSSAVQFSIFGRSNENRTVSSSANAYINPGEAIIRINNSISIAEYGTGAVFTAVFFSP